MRADGFVKVTDLLANPRVSSLDLAQLQEMVKTNAKQRFALIQEEDVWLIKANQGHSLKGVKELELQPILSIADIPSKIAVHGTTNAAWQSISVQGLSRMSRNHIHLAQGAATDDVISGMRRSSQILIFVDIERALADGLKFSLSQNGVVLTEGDEKGFLATKYFMRVETAQQVAVVATKAYATPSASPIPSATSRSRDSRPPIKRVRVAPTPQTASTAPDAADIQRERALSKQRFRNVIDGLAEKYTMPIHEDDLVDFTTLEIIEDRGVSRAKLGGEADVSDQGDENIPTDEEDDFDELDLIASAENSMLPADIVEQEAQDELLAEFLEAERLRKEQCGEDDEEQEDDEDEQEQPLESLRLPTPIPASKPARHVDEDSDDELNIGWGVVDDSNRVRRVAVVDSEPEDNDEAHSPTPVPSPPRPRFPSPARSIQQLATPPKSQTPSSEQSGPTRSAAKPKSSPISSPHPSPSKRRAVPASPASRTKSTRLESPRQVDFTQLAVGSAKKTSGRKPAAVASAISTSLKTKDKPSLEPSHPARKPARRSLSAPRAQPPVKDLHPPDRKGKGRLVEPAAGDIFVASPSPELRLTPPPRRVRSSSARRASPPPEFLEGSSRPPEAKVKKRKRQPSSSSSEEWDSSPIKATSSRRHAKFARSIESDSEDGHASRHRRSIPAAMPPYFPAPYPAGVAPVHDPRAMQILSHYMVQALYAMSVPPQAPPHGHLPEDYSPHGPFSYPSTPRHSRHQPYVLGSGATLPPSSPPSVSSSPMRPALVARSRSRGRRVSFSLDDDDGVAGAGDDPHGPSRWPRDFAHLSDEEESGQRRGRSKNRAQTPGPGPSADSKSRSRR
ncbi:Trna phosphotransferase 1 [Mycena chlorophos]|uniref:2'-phosphotransferase n=1 Tax=Mycena chlorophos TaxID=658473 RepID=A0A8H6VZK4_MYCCL|nr:Trna phosphotransferase 1 [Mycena chlorophos]